MYVYDDRVETAVKNLENRDSFDTAERYDEAEEVLEEFEESTLLRLFKELVDLELDSKMSLADIRHELVRVTAERIKGDLNER